MGDTARSADPGLAGLARPFAGREMVARTVTGLGIRSMAVPYLSLNPAEPRHIVIKAIA